MESSKISENDVEDDVAMHGFSDVQKGCPKCYIGESTQNKGLLARLRKDTEYRFKFQTFLCLVWSFFILGWILGQFGPSLFDLQIITKTDLEDASFFYMSHNIGYLIGSLVSGVLIGRCDCNLLLFITMAIYGISVIVIPWSFRPSIMLCSQAVRGLSGGLLDTVANSELLRLFGNQVSSYMQAMHFAFAVGGIVSPLATAPFLADEYSHVTTLNSSYPSISHELILTTEGSELNKSGYDVHNNSQPFVSTLSRNSESLELFIPYTMSGLLAFSSSVSFLVVYIKSRKFRKKIEIRTEIERNERKLTAITKIVVLSILSIIFLLYTAIEDTVGAYVATFCVKQMKMSKQQASYVTALFWALFAFGRLSGILIGIVVRSIPLVGIYSVLLMISFLLLSFASSFDSQVIVWVSTAITGFAMSILFPTLFTWTEEDFLLVTGKIASLFIMTSTAGSIASPAALGYLIEEVSPMWYAYILLGESIGVTFFFAIAILLKKRLPQLQDQQQREITTVDVVSSVIESNPEQCVLINSRDNIKSLQQ